MPGTTLVVAALSLSGLMAPAMAQVGPQPMLQIGALEEPEEAVFGVIAGLTVLPDGRVVVLDSRLHRLSVFTARGEFVHAVGRTGAGPGEFLLPEALAVVGDTVYVLDRRAARITEFLLGDTLRYHDSHPASGQFYDLCAMGGQLYGLGYLNGAVVHVLRRGDAGWSVASSVGQAGSQNPLVAQGFADGYLACAPGLGTVIWTSRQAGTITALNANGEERWSRTIDGFLRMRITENVDGRVSYEYPNSERWHHMVAGIAVVGDEVLTTYGRSTPSVGVDDDPIDLVTIVLDLRTGELRRRTSVRAVARATDRSRGIVWSTTSRPFPRILGSPLIP